MPTKSLRSRTWIALAVFVVLACVSLVACDTPKRASDGYILVFDYGEKFIPVEQLHLAGEDACKDDHWHAAGQVVTLRGEVLEDPNPLECGFGRDYELEVREVLMPDDYQGVQRTDPEWRFQDDDQ